MSVYIAYRDLVRHFMDNSMMGGVPQNNDIRLATAGTGVYLLSFGNVNYAVTDERAEQFVKDVLAKCTGKNRGLFPFVREYNGKKTAAVVEVHEGSDYGYYDMDDEVLLKMLEDLKGESGEPLDEKALINYCYPNPKLPEGDFDLKYVYHQIYYKPVNTPASVIQSYVPDKKTSALCVEDGKVVINLYDNGTVTDHEVPYELVPEIKDRVRELCKDPADAYVDNGAWEAYVRFGSADGRIFTDPEKTMALIREFASKGTQVIKEPEPVKSAPVDVCPVCGTSVAGSKYCQFCGAKLI